MEKINSIIAKVKEIITVGKQWLQTNGDIKVYAIGLIIGVLTFGSWAAFFLAALTFGALYLFKTKIPAAYLSMVNINFDKYFINAILGLVSASLINFILF